MPYVCMVYFAETMMASEIRKKNVSGMEGTSSNMVVEELRQPHQVQQFADTNYQIKKKNTTLTWSDIYND